MNDRHDNQHETQLLETHETFELPEIQTSDDIGAGADDLAGLAQEPPPAIDVGRGRRRRRNRAPFAAAAATALLVGAMVVTLMRGDDAETAATGPDAATTSTDASLPAAEPGSSVPTLEPLPEDEDGAAPLPDLGDTDLPAPEPELPDLPPPGPPSSGASLTVTTHYALDPGVDALSVTLGNDGEDELHYEVANDGDGFDATSNETGTIAPGETTDVWIELELTSEGEGPTPFSRTVEIESDGGDATVTIEGQVEQPGFLVAEFESIPLVDYRATLRFTNIGGLPIELTAVEAPGLTLAPLPDAVVAGETLELEVAICEGADLPTFFPTPAPPNPLPLFHFASWVTLETPAGTATTGVAGTSFGFFPPSCEAVVPGLGELVLELDDGIHD